MHRKSPVAGSRGAFYASFPVDAPCGAVPGRRGVRLRGGGSASAQISAPCVRAGRRPRRPAIVGEDRPVNRPDARKRENAARRGSVAEPEAAIPRAGAGLDPRPVPGTAGARAPAAARSGARTRECPSIPASRARIAANLSPPGRRFRGSACRGRYAGSRRPPNPGESPGPRWPDPPSPLLPPAIR